MADGSLKVRHDPAVGFSFAASHVFGFSVSDDRAAAVTGAARCTLQISAACRSNFVQAGVFLTLMFFFPWRCEQFFLPLLFLALQTIVQVDASGSGIDVAVLNVGDLAESSTLSLDVNIDKVILDLNACGMALIAFPYCFLLLTGGRNPCDAQKQLWQVNDRRHSFWRVKPNNAESPCYCLTRLF